MACGCRGTVAGATTSSGGKVMGYEVTFPDGSKHDELLKTPTEAKKVIRQHGGGTAEAIVDDGT